MLELRSCVWKVSKGDAHIRLFDIERIGSDFLTNLFLSSIYKPLRPKRSSRSPLPPALDEACSYYGRAIFHQKRDLSPPVPSQLYASLIRSWFHIATQPPSTPSERCCIGNKRHQIRVFFLLEGSRGRSCMLCMRACR